MSRAYRATMVAVLAILATPGLISLKNAEPPEPPPNPVRQAPAASEKAPPRTGTADIRLLGVNDFHGNLEPPYAVDGTPVNTSDPDFTGAEYPYVAANTLYRDSDEPVLPPYKVVERDGVRVGFIGVTTSSTPERVAATWRGEDSRPGARRRVPERSRAGDG